MATAPDAIAHLNPISNAAAGLSRQELEAFWMPFTGNRQFKDNPRMIVAADGCHYITADGRKVLDSLSGLWCCGYGHNRSEIADAVSHQLRNLDYAPGFQFGQPLSFQLANRITALTPPGLDHVFFTDSGSFVSLASDFSIRSMISRSPVRFAKSKAVLGGSPNSALRSTPASMIFFAIFKFLRLIAVAIG